MERILAAVDGSEHANRAVQLAADLATRYEVPLHVVHVMARTGTGRVPPGLAEYERLENIYLNEADVLRSAGERIVEAGADEARQAGHRRSRPLSRREIPPAPSSGSPIRSVPTSSSWEAEVSAI